MPVQSAELALYCAINMPTADGATTGGAVDAKTRPVFSQLSVNSAVKVASSSGADTTQILTAYGRNAQGAITSETITLAGTSSISGTLTLERVLRAVLNADCAGTVTVAQSDGTVISTIPPAERGFRVVFYDAGTTDMQTVRREKLFWKNTNGTLALSSAKVQLSSDPMAKIKHGVAPSKGDSATISDRLDTAPAGVTFVDDAVDQSVPTGALAAGETVGIWAEMTLAASDPDAPFKSSFTCRLSGASF